MASYFKDSPEQVENIGNHILDQRQEKEKEVIRRKVPKGEGGGAGGQDQGLS